MVETGRRTRGRCSVCGRTYRIKKDNTVRHHYSDEQVKGGEICPGSNIPPRKGSVY